MNDYRLVIFAQDQTRTTIRELNTALTHAGFIGPGYQDNQFLVGDNFLRLITFLGCSPAINMDPDRPDLGPVCLISPAASTGKPAAFISSGTRPPRCRACNNPEKHWRQHLKQWQDSPSTNWVCNSCGNQGNLPEQDWRHRAGFANLWVEVSAIFPSEAIPADSLLKVLHDTTSTDWDWCYLEPDKP